MDDLEITDSEGDRFRLLNDGRNGEVVLDTEHDQVYVTERDARDMTLWLIERFGLGDADLPADQSVTISVPGAAGGTTREVFWSGQGAPPEWLQQLATIALGAAPARPDYYRERVTQLRALLDERAPVDNPQGADIATRVEDLIDRADHNQARWRELADTLQASDTEGALATARLVMNPDRWRAVLSALGAGTAEEAAKIAQTWRTWLDEAGRILIRQGVADVTAQVAIDPVRALNLLLNKHSVKLKTQTQYYQDREREAVAAAAARLESAVAREREVRAPIQADRDEWQRRAEVTEAKYRDALRLNTELLEKERAARTLRIGADTRAAELAQRLEANREELAALREAFDKMRDALQVVQQRGAGSEETIALVDEALREVG